MLAAGASARSAARPLDLHRLILPAHNSARRTAGAGDSRHRTTQKKRTATPKNRRPGFFRLKADATLVGGDLLDLVPRERLFRLHEVLHLPLQLQLLRRRWRRRRRLV